MRSSRAPTSLFSWLPPLAPRSMRRAMARASGAPIIVTPIMMNRTIGMSSPGIRTDGLRGVDARRGQGKSNLCSTTDRAHGMYAPVMREHRLACNRQPQPGAARLVRHVRFPDSRQALGRNAAPGITNRDDDSIIAVVPFASDRHADAGGLIGAVAAPGAARVDRVQ